MLGFLQTFQHKAFLKGQETQPRWAICSENERNSSNIDCQWKLIEATYFLYSVQHIIFPIQSSEPPFKPSPTSRWQHSADFKLLEGNDMNYSGGTSILRPTLSENPLGEVINTRPHHFTERSWVSKATKNGHQGAQDAEHMHAVRPCPGASEELANLTNDFPFDCYLSHLFWWLEVWVHLFSAVIYTLRWQTTQTAFSRDLW